MRWHDEFHDDGNFQKNKIVWTEAGKAPLRGCGGRAVSLSYKESKPGPSFPELGTKRPANQCHNPHHITTSMLHA